MNSDLSTEISNRLIEKLTANLPEIINSDSNYQFFGGKWNITKDISCKVLYCCMASDEMNDDATDVLIWNYNDGQSKAEFPTHFIYFDYAGNNADIFISAPEEIKITPSTMQQQAFLLAGIEKLTDNFPMIWNEFTTDEVEFQKKLLNQFFIQSQKFDVEK